VGFIDMINNQNLKVALVHDFLVDFGGAERVLEVLSEMYPEAPIYTLLYDKHKMRGRFKNREIHTSFLQKFPKFLRRRKKWLLPFFMVAPETFDLRDFDLVISSSGAWSKGIVTRLNTQHIAYIHSPMRFVWDYSEQYLKDNRKEKMGFCIRPLLNYVRVWDKLAADRPDHMISNSKYTQKRVAKYYGRESIVVYPPVDIVPRRDESMPRLYDGERYFLIVSRLSPYKKVDAVVEAFNKLGLPLIVVGEGSQKKYLQKIANDNVQILGWKSDEEIVKYYAQARAFVFAGVDDFGIAPVEAMAQGVPVLAVRKGGALEIVEEGKTGEFFDVAVPEVIADGVRRFVENEKNYNKQDIVDKAGEFSKERFIKEMGEYVENILKSKD